MRPFFYDTTIHLQKYTYLHKIALRDFHGL